MDSRRLAVSCSVVSLAVFLTLTVGCWKSDEAPEAPVTGPTEVETVDLGREDMAALPGADVDVKLLGQFPHYLRQETSMQADEIFAYYDDFFRQRGWSVENAADPLSQQESHRYQLGEELAFLIVIEAGQGRREVVLTRRQMRDDERAPAGQ